MPNAIYRKPYFKQTLPNPLTNERGIALIIAVSLLAVMSVLGALLMSSSSTEIQLSGNYRFKQESLYAADRGVEYAMAKISSKDDEDNFNIQADLDNINAAGDNNAGLKENKNFVTSKEEPANPELWNDENSAIYTTTKEVPMGSGTQLGIVDARYYRITMTGVSPASAINPAITHLRVYVAKYATNTKL